MFRRKDKSDTWDLDERSRVYRWGRRKGQPKPHPKLRQRAAAVRRRPWWVAGILALVLALIGGVIYLFGFSTAFVVEQVTVAGSEGEIADGAREIGASTLGRPLARVDTDRLEELVLEDLRVATVDVGRSWPSTITLDLTLRQPALAIDQSGTRGVLLADSEGVVYDTVDKAPSDVIAVRAPSGDLDPVDLQAVQTVPAALPPAIARRTDGLRLTGAGEIQFQVGTIAVTWGDGSSPELKARTLEALLAQDGIDPTAEPEEGAEPITIDLSTPTTAVVTGLETAEPTA
ncbi:FtsQ-type POTRA domain-containing protein [Ornithinimicrobium sp. F0845]|uniref:cell division protein FtsQ/DivIB n=1 Tax=Ornithinimicrobium sp. F0845 TaxID=2926412 RepID=UPI001FF54850|nr:FtsQ-type POTRA domain-containing protein [Ornithinimicrobium sp. F0845]MCK0112670.1 FtsQ-type POTRA domain-containing protein [Ornithinimicrobium sp. F0845]